MASDTNSTFFGLTYMATGNDPTTWGDITNANLVLLENAIAGISSFNSAGGTVTPSTAQLATPVHVFTGSLSVSNILFPVATSFSPNPRLWIVVNNTTSTPLGKFTVNYQVIDPKAGGVLAQVALNPGNHLVYLADDSTIWAT